MLGQWLGRCGDVFSRRPLLVLFTLLMLSGLCLGLIPVTYVYFFHHADASATSGTAPASRGIASNRDARCNRVSVSFSSAATIRSITQLMDRLDASVTYGPDQDGAFELAVASDRAAAMVDDLNASDLVVAARLLSACR